MPREIHFNGRKPSKAQVLKHVRALIKDGWNDIQVYWGENRIEIENINGYWYGSGWIRGISGQDLANFELNERRSVCS
jgi:hypothetical protein